MASWSEIDPKLKYGILSLVCVLIAAGVWYAMVRPTEQLNVDDLAALKGKKIEITQLMPFQAKIAQLNKDIESYRQQIEQQKEIVPEDKQVEGFIRQIQVQARSSGIEIRRFTSLPIVTREFYSEVPFELELDGSYFGVVRFFEQIGKMDRLVSVSGLNMANVKTPSQAKVKKTYKYAPGETVVATCTASAFFSPKAPPPPPPQAPKVLAPKK
ncbi:MAG: type 4a pilus biogenesis protein PilO [Candidatus Korobacteraceae bacterium]|jgi:type IV pilus assembly protein PilO